MANSINSVAGPVSLTEVQLLQLHSTQCIMVSIQTLKAFSSTSYLNKRLNIYQCSTSVF